MKEDVDSSMFARSMMMTVSIIFGCAILGLSFMNRNRAQQTIAVTGLGKANFTSDLIVWEGAFSETSTDLSQAYKRLSNDKQIVSAYLKKVRIEPASIVFQAIDTRRNYQRKYTAKGDYGERVFKDYTLTQKVKIKSKAVENVSRQITSLLDKGIPFYSEPPRYYYTQLENLKIEMISAITKNAQLRAKQIADHADAKLG